MTIKDIRTLPPSTRLQADICIVGAGPAGISLALQFADTNIRVIVLESGGLERDPETEDLNEIESVGLRRAPQDVTRCRGLGGTSALWSGRCGILDAIDYQARPWIPNSGWPICQDDIAPFIDRAARMLGLGPAFYGRLDMEYLLRKFADLPWDSGKLLPVIFQASLHDAGNSRSVRSYVADGVEGAEMIGALQHAGMPMPRRFGDFYRSALEASNNIDVLLNANVTEIVTNDSGNVAQEVRVGTLTGQTYHLAAKRIVLACGGIDNARLLLSSQARDPRGVGNARDNVGRFLMDHPYVPIAFYRGEGSEALRRQLGSMWFDHRGVRHVFSQGFKLHPEIQRRQSLLNCAVHVLEFGDAPAPISRLGKALRLIKNRQFGAEIGREIFGAVRDPARLAQGLLDRYWWGRPSLQRPTRIEFGCVLEQIPDRESRVSLSGQRDALGMQRARIDWRASDLEYSTACHMAEVMQGEFARLGFARPQPADWLAEGPNAYRALIHDMAHPLGSTRMSSDPAHGVVDINSKVHGVDHLYVVGGSTFSTSGYINPTLMIVSFALRLADHLKRSLNEPVLRSAGPSVAVEVPVRKRAKIGIVGAGDRISRIYAPIFKAMPDEYQVVGITSRSAEKASKLAASFGANTYGDIRSLVEKERPSFLLVAVPDRVVQSIIEQIVPLGVPVLLETPFGWNVRKGRQLLRKIEKREMTFGVAEQTPLLPAEQLKQRLIELGLIGDVRKVHNGCAVYAYHGLAAMKSYLPNQRQTHICAERRASSADTADQTSHDPGSQTQLRATISLKNGASMLHWQFDEPSEISGRLSVAGTSGKLVDDALMEGEQSEAVAVNKFHRDADPEGGLMSLVVETSLGEVRWTNPFPGKGFNDEQIAVASVLDRMVSAVNYGAWPSYDAARAQNDMELLTAIRYSLAMRGREVNLPLKPLTELVASRISRLLRTGSKTQSGTGA